MKTETIEELDLEFDTIADILQIEEGLSRKDCIWNVNYTKQGSTVEHKQQYNFSNYEDVKRFYINELSIDRIYSDSYIMQLPECRLEDRLQEFIEAFYSLERTAAQLLVASIVDEYYQRIEDQD
jgi:hypothetical protein